MVNSKISRRNLNATHHKCTGCRLCEFACVRQHYGNIINPELSRIRVDFQYPGPIAVPIQCSNCEDHPCVDACPLKPPVIHFDEKHMLIIVDKERCLGYKCSRCAQTCREKRSDAIHYSPPDHDYAIVCDQCVGAGPNGVPDPQCAKICPSGVFFYAPPRGGKAFRYAKSSKEIAEDISERLSPGMVERKCKTLPETL